MTSATKELTALLNGDVMGSLIQTAHGQVEFTYDDTWRRQPTPTPLSLSMPTSVKTHENKMVFPFLDGLLPDNDAVRARWRSEFEVRSRHPFALLRYVGADVAGGVQFVFPQQVEQLHSRGSVEWLSESQIAGWLRTLARDPSAWHLAATGGQFSLGGAQAKIALLHDGDMWGRPSGVIPTTHILKPAIPGHEFHYLNEHLCLRIARALSLPAPESEVREFDGVPVVVVTRYDRLATDSGWSRLHQEDICQALGVGRDRKYQRFGGPGPKVIVELLKNEGTAQDVERNIASFIDYLAFQWLIGGTDAHAKNYSVLLSGPRVRLAPLYDIASGLPLSAAGDLHFEGIRMAMSIGGTYGIAAVTGSRWIRFAQEAGLEAEQVLTRVERLVDEFPDVVAQECQALAAIEMAPGFIGDLSERLLTHGERCRSLLRLKQNPDEDLAAPEERTGLGVSSL